jgi:hypothetical protein
VPSATGRVFSAWREGLQMTHTAWTRSKHFDD